VELRIPFRDLLIAAVLSLLCRLRHGQSAWEICSRFRLQRVLEGVEGGSWRVQTVWARAAAESLAAAMDLMRCRAAWGVAVPAVARWLDSAVGSRLMTQGLGSERSPVDGRIARPMALPPALPDSRSTREQRGAGCFGLPSPKKRFPKRPPSRPRVAFFWHRRGVSPSRAACWRR
jgi:hypothetical protein